jgi:dihydroorotase
VDSSGKLYGYLKRAPARGGRWDGGHPGGSVAKRNPAPAIQQGFYPDSISTDLHTGSMNAGMMDMPTTMSKLLVMGMPLKEVIRASTWTPARMIQREELGHLSVGAVADVAVFQLMKGKFGYVDAYGARLEGGERLFCELTLSGGRQVWNWNGRGGDDYRKLAPDYGIRRGIDRIIPPPR